MCQVQSWQRTVSNQPQLQMSFQFFEFHCEFQTEFVVAFWVFDGKPMKNNVCAIETDQNRKFKLMQMSKQLKGPCTFSG